MNRRNANKNKLKKARILSSAKECAYLSMFVAFVLSLQLILSAVPGVELVTVCFVSYAFAMGVRRGMLAATAFTFLRQFVFGFFPTVFILYIIYFNLLAWTFGTLGKYFSACVKDLVWLVIVACLCTIFFTTIDNILTPIWYGYTPRAIRAYYLASLPFMIPQVICTAISVSVLFLPLVKVFYLAKRGLRGGKVDFREK